MASLVIDPDLEARLLRERRESGADHRDEVWDGVYVMSPLADDEHQELVSGFDFVFHTVIVLPRLGRVRPGVNISDRADDWTRNYRCPDVAVFLDGTAARNRGTHWLGGPDFAVEVLSEGDRARQKLAFYAAVATREVLLIDRDPWALELYRLGDGSMAPAGVAKVGDAEPIASAVLGLTFRLLPGEERPRIRIGRQGEDRAWHI